MRAIRLFKVAGIEVRIHLTFFILPFLAAYFYGKDYGLMVGVRAFALVCLIFLCVLLHEFSHSLRARGYGIAVPYITLYPMGGVASMQRIPKNPRQEFFISVVGPLFNFALAAALFFPLYFLIGPHELFSPSLDTWAGVFSSVFWANPVLGAFNLIPAFPMDGGRILRSALAARMDYVRATRISVLLGRIFAILFFLFGAWHREWTLILVAGFVFIAAGSEEKQVLAEEALRRLHESGIGP